jgi:hypothetical protein
MQGAVRLPSCRYRFGKRLTDPSPDDGQKLVGMQAGAANQGAVQAGTAKQRGGVIRHDAATVLYGKGLSRLGIEHLTEAAPNDGVRLLSLLGGGAVSGFADRSDRLVCDGQAGQGIRRHPGQSLNKLPIEHRFILVCLTLVQRFTDA